MIKLFNSPASTAMSAHAALEEIGCAYDNRWVDIEVPLSQRDPEFQALTPHGSVPVLVDDDGTVVFEGTAILIYLADRFPEARLGPAMGDPRRGDFPEVADLHDEHAANRHAGLFHARSIHHLDRRA